MTSPYITFEEMEEGVIHNARNKASGELMWSQYKKTKRNQLWVCGVLGWQEVATNEKLVFTPIPVYSPPNSWDEYIHDLAEYPEFNTDGKFGYIHGDFRKNSSDKCLKAAIEWLQDELDRRKKAGES